MDGRRSELVAPRGCTGGGGNIGIRGAVRGFFQGPFAFTGFLPPEPDSRRQSQGCTPFAWPQVAATPTDVIWRDGNARLLRPQYSKPKRGSDKPRAC